MNWDLLLAWGLPLAIAVALAARGCWIAIRWAPQLGLVDRPGSEAHKQHQRTTPYGGGLAMAVAVALALLVGERCCPLPGDVPWAVFAGAACCLLIGLRDDWRPLSPWVKLAAVAAVAAPVVSLGDLSVDFLRRFDPALAWAMAWAWLVFVTNAYNLLDHADGLCGSIALVGCATLAGGAALAGDEAGARSWLCVAAALAGFLLFNRPPARIYMGDAGSLALGFLIGCGTLAVTFWPSGEGGSPLAVLSPLLICYIALFDTVAVMVKRWRRGQPLLRGDRRHISHRLARLGVGSRAGLGAVIALQVALAAASFLLRGAELLDAVVIVAQAAAVAVALVLLETARDHA
ncbi:MAG: MraY family glycosyltransferase [Planctomycetota bacterium]|nr:undecaprenyl/decaprenyl-phosphate alpha-N-acetylglucosaminyl 1-phosphate transferase [Planctomycetota bacterium]MCX8040688.1 undecaprenyl/decaprenyl-phosphate alpha-N-acetylglucosaminyl 1-phosphate transferase [Planctomycetota bacterium]MDW8373681.1 MraY family glycosyltransferase [Planctomycetota bacterium]